MIDQNPMAYLARPSWLLPPVEQLNEFPTERIATNLSRLNRYAGAVEWTVAQHCLLVHDLCIAESKRVRLWALLRPTARASRSWGPPVFSLPIM